MDTKLRGVDFGPVWTAAGACGFFGEGYWFHHLPFGPNFKRATLVSKTTTTHPRKGNMKLTDDHRPKHLFPDSVWMDWREGIVLNATGLSNPGAEALFLTGHWQKLRKPLLISYMAVAPTGRQRMLETEQFTVICKKYLPTIKAPIGLQINFSCSNCGVDIAPIREEINESLHILGTLDIPLVPKFNLEMPPEMAAEIAQYPVCDAICQTNAIHWRAMANKIDWDGLFGKNAESPLKKYGGGALSGKPLLPLLHDWTQQARRAGLRKPINAGGGILSLDDADYVFAAGADSIFLGSAGFLRPWRVAEIVRETNSYNFFE